MSLGNRGFDKYRSSYNLKHEIVIIMTLISNDVGFSSSRKLETLLSYNDFGGTSSSTVSALYIGIACTIFILLAFQLLFPSNRFFPIDRRTSSITSAVLVYCSHKFLLKNEADVNLIEAVDFDVLLLLSAIMIINHLVLHLKETKKAIRKVQKLVREHPLKGFWIVSASAFCASPFLTNDGVCLLFVAPILSTFENLSTNRIDEEEGTDASKKDSKPLLDNFKLHLQSSDALYFMLTLACSANIGSALTYTGNPQNMIVASDSLDVLPPIKFLGYMFMPSLLAWVGTTWYISYCWVSERRAQEMNERLGSIGSFRQCCPGISLIARYDPARAPSKSTVAIRDAAAHQDLSDSEEEAYTASALANEKSNASFNNASSGNAHVAHPMVSAIVCGRELDLPPVMHSLSSPIQKQPKTLQTSHGTSDTVMQKLGRVLFSPVPYLTLLLLFAMIVMIFVDVMAISALVCISALVMVLALVFGNHWKQSAVWVVENENESDDAADGDNAPLEASDAPVIEELSLEARAHQLDEFFEDMFQSIDYNLLFIFLGLFVVVANMESTGLPKRLWDYIAGDQGFASTANTIGICVFIAVASQFLGNVAICQLAKPRVTDLGDDEKRLAWALISFVSTVAGNLTLTGSAANLIVAEKCSRIDRSNTIDFWKHIRVCCGACVVSCVVGGYLITLTNKIELSYNS